MVLAQASRGDGVFFIFPCLLFFVVGTISLAAFVFWIWMLIDCAIHEPSDTDKIVWILIIIFASLIGAIIYFFVRRPQRIREHGR